MSDETIPAEETDPPEAESEPVVPVERDDGEQLAPYVETPDQDPGE